MSPRVISGLHSEITCLGSLGIVWEFGRNQGKLSAKQAPYSLCYLCSCSSPYHPRPFLFWSIPFLRKNLVESLLETQNCASMIFCHVEQCSNTYPFIRTHFTSVPSFLSPSLPLKHAFSLPLSLSLSLFLSHFPMLAKAPL